MPCTGSPVHVDPEARGVLPSWLLGPAAAAAVWTAIAPYAVDLAGTPAERAGLGPLPGGVVLACALVDWRLWVQRGKPWHDWAVILLLLPAIAAAVWVAVGALVLDIGASRTDVLTSGVGPGVALVGLLTTTISFHGRHHPDEAVASAAGSR
jgi:hypothetical protein